MNGKVILLTSDSIGAQENGLGATILETFLTLLKQREE